MAKTATEIRLDHESLLMLLEEVCAMADAARPLMVGLADLDDLAMGKLAGAARAVRSSIQQGRSAAESIAMLSGRYAAPVRAAMEAMASTGSTEPVHETIRMMREEQQDRRRLKLATINPIVNVIVGSVVLFLVLPWLFSTLTQMQFIRSPDAPTAAQMMKAFSIQFGIVAIIVVLVVVLLVWTFSRFSSSDSANDKQKRDHSTFCRWLAMQICPESSASDYARGGPDLGNALRVAAEVVGPPFSQAWSGVSDRLRAGGQSLEALRMPADTPTPVQQCIERLAGGTADVKTVASDLNRLSELYARESYRQRVWWTEWLPRWIAWAWMIVILVMMLRAILVPIAAAIGEVLR